jgi:hypothetical protein
MTILKAKNHIFSDGSNKLKNSCGVTYGFFCHSSRTTKNCSIFPFQADYCTNIRVLSVCTRTCRPQRSCFCVLSAWILYYDFYTFSCSFHSFENKLKLLALQFGI